MRIGRVGESRDSPNFWSTPHYLSNGQSYERQIWQIYSEGQCEQKPIKTLEENGTWTYIQGLPKFSEYPILSQELVNLRTSTFVRTFLVSIGKKSSTNFWKSNRMRSEDSQNFLGHPYIERIAWSSLRQLSWLIQSTFHLSNWTRKITRILTLY